MAVQICDMNCLKCAYADCINDSDDFTFEELSIPDSYEEVSPELQKKRDRANRYTSTHREECRAKSLEYYYKNKEKLCEKSRKWNKENPKRVAFNKRRRWSENPELHRQKQRDYRKRVKESLPQCDECEFVFLVQNSKGDGCQRVCSKELRLIERKVSSSPRWCPDRKEQSNDTDSSE